MATATLLAQPRFTVFDANGNPVSGALIHTYVPGGTTPKTSWQDAAETIPNANPIVCDAVGSCLLYGSGSYQLTVTDALGVAVPGYSGVTTDTLAAVTAETVRATAAEAANTTAIALRALSSSFTSSLAAFGWEKSASGTIRQWGSTVTAAGGGLAVGFAITFPNAVWNIKTTVQGSTGTAVNVFPVGNGSYNASSFTTSTGVIGGPVAFFWEALGN